VLFRRTKNCNRIREKDSTARAILNLGRRTGKVRPYVIQSRQNEKLVIVDTDLLERFIVFCSTLNEYGLTDIELSIFMAKLSTETETRMSEEERALVFNKLSEEILKIVNYEDTTDKIITEEYRVDSQKNEEENNTCY